MQTLTRRGVGDAAAGLGLHFLHMSEGPFSHDAGHIEITLMKRGRVIRDNRLIIWNKEM